MIITTANKLEQVILESSEMYALYTFEIDANDNVHQQRPLVIKEGSQRAMYMHFL